MVSCPAAGGTGARTGLGPGFLTAAVLSLLLVPAASLSPWGGGRLELAFLPWCWRGEHNFSTSRQKICLLPHRTMEVFRLPRSVHLSSEGLVPEGLGDGQLDQVQWSGMVDSREDSCMSGPPSVLPNIHPIASDRFPRRRELTGLLGSQQLRQLASADCISSPLASSP